MLRIYSFSGYGITTHQAQSIVNHFIGWMDGWMDVVQQFLCVGKPNLSFSLLSQGNPPAPTGTGLMMRPTRVTRSSTSTGSEGFFHPVPRGFLISLLSNPLFIRVRGDTSAAGSREKKSMLPLHFRV